MTMKSKMLALIANVISSLNFDQIIHTYKLKEDQISWMHTIPMLEH